MPRLALLLLVGVSCLRAADVREGPLKDLNGTFPLRADTSPETLRAMRTEVAVALGLHPALPRPPLNPVIHGRIDQGDYTIDKVYFESAPGFYVTGNLYRPKQVVGRIPAVLFAHGHWKDARFLNQPPEYVRQEIATGQEAFVEGGKSRFQSMCVQLARMGCLVWQWDSLSDGDSIQLSETLVHRFATQRPEMNRAEGWGLYSPQAEARLQSVMGLQTWNNLRSLDFVLGLPEVDPARVAVTGASGGGTQTMMLSALDDRVALSFPAVMVSTAMQGGCTCENASLLRIDRGNVDFAALFAPKPQGMTTANDWTKEMAKKGFPELRAYYERLGAGDNVMLHRDEKSPHNYNRAARQAFYGWLNRHFRLGLTEPIVERDYPVLGKAELTVWDAAHPAPRAADPEFERGLLRWFDGAATAALQADLKAGGGAVATGWRTLARPRATGAVTCLEPSTQWRSTHFEIQGVLRDPRGEEVAIEWLQPVDARGDAVIWLDPAGKAGLRDERRQLRPAVQRLLAAGTAVIGADLYRQGDEPGAPTRKVKEKREAAAYTFGYNECLAVQRAHDIRMLRDFLGQADHGAGLPALNGPVKLVAWGWTAPLAAMAALDLPDTPLALDTAGFRFATLTDFRHPMFVPGAVKYLDVPGLLAALPGPRPLWLAGEGRAAAGLPARPTLTTDDGPAAARQERAVDWLLR
jgi:dienelactone hydrolase